MPVAKSRVQTFAAKRKLVSNSKTPAPLMRTHAYGELKRRILSGELAPGSFLSERQVAGWLKMSKTPVRAAFERLEAEGFIAISPQQGVVVRDLSVTDIADHFELREALETFVVSHLAGRLRPAQKAQLDVNLSAQEAAIAKGSTEDEIKLDGEFHLLLCGFLGNQELMRVMLQLRERIVRVIQQALTRNNERLHTVYPEHIAIVEAIYAGDGALAAQRMSTHLENGKQTLLSPRRTVGT